MTDQRVAPETSFDAEDFYRKLTCGVFDGRIIETIKDLTDKQTEEFAKVLVRISIARP